MPESAQLPIKAWPIKCDMRKHKNFKVFDISCPLVRIIDSLLDLKLLARGRYMANSFLKCYMFILTDNASKRWLDFCLFVI